MAPEQLIQHFQVRTPSELARTLGKPVSTVAEWFQKKRVPKAVQFEMEILTRGKLKADREQ